MEALFGLLGSPISAFGVKVGRYLERGRLGRNVHWCRHLLDDIISGPVWSCSSLADSRHIGWVVRRRVPSWDLRLLRVLSP
jgi:hypothetical protein